jgi:PPK2 family polyphosphate:nucleotide phosphotransferase
VSSDAARWRVEPGSRPRIADRDPKDTGGAPGDKEATEAALPALGERLAELQDRLYAEDRRALLVVLQGLDASGKDGTVKHVFAGVNPMGIEVRSFKAPSEEELAHDFLWRVHRHVPAHGHIGLFNRSHYEDVLVVRVEGLVPEPVWRERYGLINGFEAQLAHGGTRVVKVLLHISPEEQQERFDARRSRPDKRWKYKEGDLDVSAKWDAYVEAYEDALRETSTDHAPWYVVPADRKWLRNWAVSRIVIEELEAMDPRYPEAWARRAAARPPGAGAGRRPGAATSAPRGAGR